MDETHYQKEKYSSNSPISKNLNDYNNKNNFPNNNNHNHIVLGGTPNNNYKNNYISNPNEQI